MTWVNLNDVYVKNTGGTINGDLDVNGAITVNDGSGNGTKYNVANEISTLRDSVSQMLVKVAYSGESNQAIIDTSSWKPGLYYIATARGYISAETNVVTAFAMIGREGTLVLKQVSGTMTANGRTITATTGWYATVCRTVLALHSI